VEVTDPRTEVGRLGLALNAMLAQIERAFSERLASEDRLRRFLADASHELRTPLTSIRGYAELFRRGAGQRPDDLAASLRRIEQEATRMGVLVEDMLMLARLDQPRPLAVGPVDLAGIAADAVHDARAADPARSISLRSSGPLIVTGDGDRLRQVTSNLLANASIHTLAGSPVEVSVAAEDGMAVLSVADRGAGLSGDEAERVFEPFYRSDPGRGREAGGTGLGLSIVAAIAAAHGGSVNVAQRPEGGSLFRVLLPLSGEATAESHEGLPTAEAHELA
jgi:two-component system, OmpR family, sensor kinase